MREFAFGPRLDWQSYSYERTGGHLHGGWRAVVDEYVLTVEDHIGHVRGSDLDDSTVEQNVSLEAVQIATEKLLRQHLVSKQEQATKAISALNGGRRFQVGQEVSIYKDAACTQLDSTAKVVKLSRGGVQLDNGEWYRQSTARNTASGRWLAPATSLDQERVKAAAAERERLRAVEAHRVKLKATLTHAETELNVASGVVGEGTRRVQRAQKDQQEAINQEVQARRNTVLAVEREATWHKAAQAAKDELERFERALVEEKAAK